jgi:hypothetical protein
MNLQPRRSLLSLAMDEFLEVNPGYSVEVLPRRLSLQDKDELMRHAQPGSIHRFAPDSRASIWCMVLPMSSYTAPRAAFWWVSNEGKR